MSMETSSISFINLVDINSESNDEITMWFNMYPQVYLYLEL